MANRDVLRRIVLGAIAFGLCLVAAAILLMSEDSVLKLIGAGVLLGYLILASAGDWVLARQNERHVEENPHLLRNDAVGEIVTARGDFEAQTDSARGVVLLHGEIWRARCPGNHVPKDGDKMPVVSREGLTLVVQSPRHQVA